MTIPTRGADLLADIPGQDEKDQVAYGEWLSNGKKANAVDANKRFEKLEAVLVSSVRNMKVYSPGTLEFDEDLDIYVVPKKAK